MDRRLQPSGGITAVASKSDVLGLTNAKQRQDEKISAREAKQAKLETKSKMRPSFSEHSRETDDQTGSRWFGDRPTLNKVYLALLGKRPRQHSLKFELIEQVSSKVFEKDEVGDIEPPSAHSLPHATLTGDDTTA